MFAPHQSRDQNLKFFVLIIFRSPDASHVARESDHTRDNFNIGTKKNVLRKMIKMIIVW